MTHDFHCVCANCSARRRDFWRRGEPADEWTGEQIFLFWMGALLATAFLLAVMEAAGRRVDAKVTRAEHVLRAQKKARAFDLAPYTIPTTPRVVKIKSPVCGAYRVRATDGATCRECVDAYGKKYGECHN